MNDMTPARKQRSLTSDRVLAERPAARIVEKFGGLSRFCELCDFPISTVHSWLIRSGSIPMKYRGEISYQAWIMQKAAEHEIELEPSDFLDLDLPE
jgi:hypothetical protein